jgi:hypothetical protein
MYFGTKSYLKSSRNHTAKHALNEFLAGLLTMKKAPRHRIYGLWVWLLHRQDRIQISPSIGSCRGPFKAACPLYALSFLFFTMKEHVWFYFILIVLNLNAVKK